MSACKSCGAAIRWVKLAPSFKAHPLDPQPSDKGTILLADAFGGDRASVVKADMLDSARKAGVPLYTSHFATCPNAAQHRRPKP